DNAAVSHPSWPGRGTRGRLAANSYPMTLAHNIPDVNDKIYEAAPGHSAELAERATAWYLEDTADLGLGMPDLMPKVTELVPEIVEFIEKLVERGFAYPVGGDVSYRASPFPPHPPLSPHPPPPPHQH